MSLLLNKNDFQEFLCKFKGHSFSEKDKNILRSTSPETFRTSCLKCNCKLKMVRVGDHPSYLVTKIYDEEEDDNY